MIDNAGDSNYHAAQLTFRKRYDRAGVLINGAYTFSKSIDDLSIDPVGSTVGGGLTTTNSRTPVDGHNYRNERGRSDFDQRHVFNMTGVYELPFGTGKPLFGNASRAFSKVVGGGGLTPTYTYQSGEALPKSGLPLPKGNS